jgi:hypothetical protein
MYRLEARGLADLDAWLMPYRRFWAGKLNASSTTWSANNEAGTVQRLHQ